MNFELIEVESNSMSSQGNCFPDFFDDCNPTDVACIPTEMDDEAGEI